MLPDVQSEPPLAQVCTIPKHPVTGYQLLAASCYRLAFTGLFDLTG